MKWFNGQPIVHGCEDKLHQRVQVPVGEWCGWCVEPIEETQSGFLIPTLGITDYLSREMPWHRECFIRSIIGSVGHQLQQCSCFGGTAEDPEGMTKRQAAIAAFEMFEKQQSCFQSYRERMG